MHRIYKIKRLNAILIMFISSLSMMEAEILLEGKFNEKKKEDAKELLKKVSRRPCQMALHRQPQIIFSFYIKMNSFSFSLWDVVDVVSMWAFFRLKCTSNVTKSNKQLRYVHIVLQGVTL